MNKVLDKEEQNLSIDDQSSYYYSKEIDLLLDSLDPPEWRKFIVLYLDNNFSISYAYREVYGRWNGSYQKIMSNPTIKQIIRLYLDLESHDVDHCKRLIKNHWNDVFQLTIADYMDDDGNWIKPEHLSPRLTKACEIKYDNEGEFSGYKLIPIKEIVKEMSKYAGMIENKIDVTISYSFLDDIIAEESKTLIEDINIEEIEDNGD